MLMNVGKRESGGNGKEERERERDRKREEGRGMLGSLFKM